MTRLECAGLVAVGIMIIFGMCVVVDYLCKWAGEAVAKVHTWQNYRRGEGVWK
jgi:hypothetical protein